jgi:threonine synthase
MAATLVHGARVLEVEGNFDASFELARGLAERYPVTLVNSVNPYRLQGQKTCAFEIVDALGRAPDLHCVPVGNAGNISSHWLGYSEYVADGRSTSRRGCSGSRRAAPRPWSSGTPSRSRTRSPPPSGSATPRRGTWRSRRHPNRRERSWRSPTATSWTPTGGSRARVCSPSRPRRRASRVCSGSRTRTGFPRGGTVVCVLTGHGLKDPEWATSGGAAPSTVPAEADAVAAELGL